MTRRALWLIVGPAALLLAALPAAAADSVLLSLRANGQDIKGEGLSGAYQDLIECFAYEQAATAPHDANGMATGRRQYRPITFRKRIDKATPLIARAFVNNEVVEAVFHLFRTTPGGQRIEVYKVAVKGGRIVARTDVVPNTLAAATASEPASEEVSLTFTSISWTWVDGGITTEDTATSSTMMLPVKVRPTGGQ